MTLILPVANGMLPKPHGGKITGVFVSGQGGESLDQAGAGKDVLICPWIVDEQDLYPVGVIARLVRVWGQNALAADGQKHTLIMAILEGQGHARWHTLVASGPNLISDNIEPIDFKAARREYPAISGAGWAAAGGFTEFRDLTDIPVTIYGTDLETGRKVNIKANLGGLVTQEQAHTIEHGIIRALKTYGLCTARTLLDSIVKETDELKKSVEYSMRFALPEMIGRTATGACGNPMSNMAQFYLAREFVDNVTAGKSLNRSLFEAQRRTMSQLTSELGLTTRQETCGLQGLKKGMYHDDTPLKVETCKKIIRRFPVDPWD